MVEGPNWACAQLYINDGSGGFTQRGDLANVGNNANSVVAFGDIGKAAEEGDLFIAR